jgi:hypothetical protein
VVSAQTPLDAGLEQRRVQRVQGGTCRGAVAHCGQDRGQEGGDAGQLAYAIGEFFAESGDSLRIR